jgi:predicted DNA-binding protein (MmcQ/YjbR family)
VTYADIEKLCRKMRGVTLEYPFGNSKVFKVGGKMFAMIPMNGKKAGGIWFKAGESSFQILTRVKGIKPCPYLARAHWVAMEHLMPLKANELRAYLERAHAIVGNKLPRKKREALGIAPLPSEDLNPFL